MRSTPAARSGLALAALVAVSSPAARAQADALDGALGAAAVVTDYYQVTCSNDGRGAPASLATQVLDSSPPDAAIVAVQTRKGFAATNSADLGAGDAEPSAAVFVNGAAGSYDVFVDKTGSGAQTYTLSYQCMTGADGGGSPTGTAIAALQNRVPALPVAGLACAASALLAAALLRLRRGSPRAIPALAALLLAQGLPGSAAAHTQEGGLGAPEAATDFYQVTCSNDGSGPPAALIVQLLDTGSADAVPLSVQVRRSDRASTSTDGGEGDAIPSPLVWVNGGAGVYDVLIDKAGSGGQTYSLSFHCVTGVNGSGIHTGTSIAARQNQ